ncbi:Processing alpha glucosidase I [Gryganskiella cystojenkinii]|nr:Processing alpha glucosidase I [Gryganskiella cystojenkinii]
MDASGSFALGDIHFESGHANGFSSAQTAAAQNQSLLWGVYRPNLYFGTRPRLPNSVMTGLMWFGTQDYSGLDNIRHGCEEGDKFEKYGWLKHDGRSFGVQQLKDTRNNVELTTDFIKIPGGEHGGSWGARISGKPIREGEPMSISAIYYMGLDGEGTFGLDKNNFVPISPIHFSGKTADLGDFEFTLEQTKGADSADRLHYAAMTKGADSADRLHYAAMSLPQGSVWRAKDFAKEVMTQTAQVIQQSGPNRQFTPAQLFTLPNQFFGEGSNLLALQMNYDAEFEFEIRFNSKSSPNSATTKSMSQQLSKSIAAFDKRFEETFHLKEYGYSDSMVDFAKATMSNLIGGIGYFYGSSIVDESTTFEDGQNEHLEGPVARRPYPNPQMTAPASLFSAVPSRSFFPRGFYWDEGFHQSLMGQWDNDLSLDVIESWYNRQDSDGWIQREQILGDEARSRVPQEFQVQYPEHANPPTFLQAISCYIARLHNVSQTEFSVGSHGESASLNKDQDVTNARLLNRGLAKEYLTNLYPKLRTNYEWMRKTMQGKIREYGRRSHSRTEGYRWRGRTMTHTLTSGLDDYPRAPRPHVGELHVDLLSWIGFMGRNLQDIATLIGEEEDAEEFEEQYADIKANIHDLHWSEKDKAFCDVTVDEDEESVHVCHKGYISLFPMLLGIVEPKSDQLGHILDLMRDPEQMWSPYGLRSLSAKDEFFGTGENYWKGPIWINLNYLAVHSLKTHYLGKGPHQAKAKKIYNELRDNLIQNIYNEYERSGFVWEQYNDKTGHGQRSHPFTGWTSMVVLMMQMGRAH